MAGDIETSPYTLNFQADSLHSGSISFGRFENEALCWERRSSFLHNRHLEDAEKYSRSGSVNEKKAYFEAHFRRRALVKQASSGSQNGTDYPSSENDFSESTSYEYDNFGSFRERSHSAGFDEYPVREMEFEESYDPQNELQCMRQNSECDTSNHDQANMQEVQHDEAENVHVMYNEPEIKKLNSGVGTLERSCKASNVSSNGIVVERDNSVNSEHQTSDMTFDVVDLSGSHPHGETISTASSKHPDDASNKDMTATSRLRERKSRLGGMKSDRKVVITQGRRTIESRRATPNVDSRGAMSNVESRRATSVESRKATLNGESRKATSNVNSRGATSNVDSRRATSTESRKATSNGDSRKATSNVDSRRATSVESRKTTSNGESRKATSNVDSRRATSVESRKATSNGESRRVASNVNSRGATSNVDSWRATSVESRKPTSSGESRKAASIVNSRGTISNVDSRRATSVESMKAASNVDSRRSTSVESRKATSNGEFRKATSNVNSRGATSNVNSRVATSIVDSRGATSSVDSRRATSSVDSRRATSNVNSRGATSSVDSRGATSSVDSRGATSNVNSRKATSNVNSRGATSSVDSRRATSNVNSTGATSSVNSRGATSTVDSRGATSSVDSRGATSSVDSRRATSESRKPTSNGESKKATSNVDSRRATSVECKKSTSNGESRKPTSNVDSKGATSNVESRKPTPVEFRKHTSNVSSKNLVGRTTKKEGTKKEGNDLLRLKREKVVAKSASPITKPNLNRLEQKVSHDSKTKPLPLTRSADLDSRTRRTVNSLHPTSENVVYKLNSSVNGQAFSSSRPGMKQNGSAFSFKSDECVEKRREEKIGVEIKQSTKSLNFKATPTASSYHESDCGIDKSKGTPSNTKSRTPSCSEEGSERAPSASEPLKRTRLECDQEVTSSPRAARPKTSSRSAAPGSRAHSTLGTPLTTNKKQGNEKHQSAQHKDAVSVGKVGNKTRNVVERPKLNSERSGTRVARKEMKGVGVGGSAKFGRLAVGVAS